jgi:hypothetical protein
MTFEQKMAHLRPHAPTLVSLLTAMNDRPDVDQLDDWIYCCSGSYTVLGTLLSEMHPAYDGLDIPTLTPTLDGHNAFEEFVIRVWDAIARHNSAFDGHKYDIDQLSDTFLLNLGLHPDDPFSQNAGEYICIIRDEEEDEDDAS